MSHKRKISVTGLGYVGLTIATAFGQTQKVIGYDTSVARIKELKGGIDTKGDIDTDYLRNADIVYTTQAAELKNADFHIISVLTPIDKNRQPDLSILIKVSEAIGQQLKKGDIVVYESTVYPGATEEQCIPTLEKFSGLICGKDFSVGYSPERINPADKEHNFVNIVKIISATDENALNVIADVYESVIKAGVHRVSKIRIAEATKVIENTQRDLNISFINEIALILQSLDMDCAEVIAAASTKWNFLKFQPGLVGGHCIGVNSYYLTYKAEQAGYYPGVIQAGRRVNDYMPKFIAEKTVKKLIQIGVSIKKSQVAVLGLTYKENCTDLHDSKVMELIKELQSYDIDVLAHDPIASPDIAKKEFGLEIGGWEKLLNLDAIILAVAHQHYIDASKNHFKKMLKPNGLIMDIKGILKAEDYTDTKIILWRL